MSLDSMILPIKYTVKKPVHKSKVVVTVKNKMKIRMKKLKGEPAVFVNKVKGIFMSRHI